MVSNRFLCSFAVALMSAGLLSIGPALAWADDDDIVLDLVRHGESTANLAGIIDTAPPGADLDSMGVSEAGTVTQSIEHEFGADIAGVFSPRRRFVRRRLRPLCSRCWQPADTCR